MRIGGGSGGGSGGCGRIGIVGFHSIELTRKAKNIIRRASIGKRCGKDKLPQGKQDNEMISHGEQRRVEWDLLLRTSAAADGNLAEMVGERIWKATYQKERTVRVEF